MGVGAYEGHDQHILGPVEGLCGKCVLPVRREEPNAIGIIQKYGDRAFWWHWQCWKDAGGQ